jgi:hypothetical protein
MCANFRISIRKQGGTGLMTRKKDKEFIIQAGDETFNLREGERRKIPVYIYVRIVGGILHITQPDIYHEETIVKPAQRLLEVLEAQGKEG